MSRLKLFGRYSAAGFAGFLFELALLSSLLVFLPLPYYASVAVAFTVSLTLQYIATRRWVFEKSGRRIPHEYGYFFLILVSGLTITLVLVTPLVSWLGVNVYLARALSGIVSGTWSFYLNARFNFRAAPFRSEFQ